MALTFIALRSRSAADVVSADRACGAPDGSLRGAGSCRTGERDDLCDGGRAELVGHLECGVAPAAALDWRFYTLRHAVVALPVAMAAYYLAWKYGVGFANRIVEGR
jgi:hypothetical protein